MNQFLSEQELTVFKELINNYKMNSQAASEFIASNFAVIAGPAGAGKDTLRNMLTKDNPARYSAVLSTTTRPPRTGEKNAIDYHFRTKEEVRKSLEAGEFFQAALVHKQQVSCLHISEIQKLKPGQIGLSILIVQTEREMAKIKPDIRTLFIIPPNLDELKRRMQASRQLDNEEIERRLNAAKSELELALENTDYYCLVNDDLELTSRMARQFFEKGSIDSSEEAKDRQALGRLLDELSSPSVVD